MTIYNTAALSGTSRSRQISVRSYMCHTLSYQCQNISELTN